MSEQQNENFDVGIDPGSFVQAEQQQVDEEEKCTCDFCVEMEDTPIEKVKVVIEEDGKVTVNIPNREPVSISAWSTADDDNVDMINTIKQVVKMMEEITSSIEWFVMGTDVGIETEEGHAEWVLVDVNGTPISNDSKWTNDEFGDVAEEIPEAAIEKAKAEMKKLVADSKRATLVSDLAIQTPPVINVDELHQAVAEHDISTL
jgi:hypothetical protein